MSVFESPSFDNHEQVVFCRDAASGLRAIIAIHNTSRGFALGGCRMWDYASEEEAITDVLRLSRGMTYKNALADLPWGGGKSVMIGNSKTEKTPEMMQAMGRFVERLGGKYVIAEDVGTCPDDMAEMAKESQFVKGIPGEGGDPSPGTAYGVFCGIQASIQERMGKNSLDGIRVAVQGLGHVGYDVADQLKKAGAKLWVSDMNDEALAKAKAELGAEVVGLDEVYDLDVDVYAPCALGATLNDNTIPRLSAKVVAGAANNQLAEDRHGDMLHEMNILYAPDYVINAGGVIHVYHQGPDFDEKATFDHVGRLGNTLLEIYARSKKDGTATHVAADRLAEERFQAA